jgi:hypothetical protein
VIDITNYLPAKRKGTSSGWISFNAPCCVHNGESADRRQRGGIKIADTSWSYHCFNCGFTASFVPGRTLSFKSRKFLSWLAVPQQDIERINLESLKYRSVQGIIDERKRTADVISGIKFDEKDLPPAAELVTPEHTQEWQYLRDRCVPEDFPIMTVKINDSIHWTRPQVIVPFTYDNTVVGYTCRMLDKRIPKYIHDMQHGYVFGIDQQRANWQQVIVTEGVFDALSIHALAVLHAEINDAQVKLIRSLDRDVIVVPDQDQAGMKLVDRAIELGWAVSMPEWPSSIKDVNDAVRVQGRLATLIQIMQASQTNRLKIELRRRQLEKKFEKPLA